MNRNNVPWIAGIRSAGSTIALSSTGALLLWMAFPPLQLSWLAWVAPVPWVLLVRQDRLSGGHPFALMWLASLLHWLVMLQGIRLAHWLNHFGLFALSSYLACYLPLFVALCRRAVHRYRLSPLVAAPVIWTALELVRGHLFTGFSMGLLGHTQFEHPHVIQIADLAGAYAVSCLVMLVATGVALSVPWQGLPAARSSWLAVTGALVAALSYGHWSLTRRANDGAVTSGLRVALIQESFNTRFEHDPERNVRVFRQYWKRTLEARQRNRELDLIVWPESVFTANQPEVLVDGDPNASDRLRAEQLAAHQAAFAERIQQMAQGINRGRQEGGPARRQTYLIVGTETYQLAPGGERLFNTALLIGPEGEIVDRYYKMHPVMFGEYIPLGGVFPLIYEWTPLPQGLTPGPSPAAFEVEGKTLAPSICFESTVPHLARRQVRQLTRSGQRPLALVNITHDGWFWGSSILDLQLACAVFRAVELRRTMLVAANAGISAVIDPRGRIVERGPRQGGATLVTQIDERGWESWYLRWGDLPAGLGLLATLCLLLPPRGRSRTPGRLT